MRRSSRLAKQRRLQDLFGGCTSANDSDFQVTELSDSELLVGSPNAGFETVSVVGYGESLIVRAARVAADVRRAGRWVH